MFQDMIGNGAIAQLGERLHGMQEVSGSIPLGSTIKLTRIKYADISKTYDDFVRKAQTNFDQSFRPILSMC